MIAAPEIVKNVPPLATESETFGNAIDFLSEHVADEFPCEIDRCGWSNETALYAVLSDGTVYRWSMEGRR